MSEESVVFNVFITTLLITSNVLIIDWSVFCCLIKTERFSSEVFIRLSASHKVSELIIVEDRKMCEGLICQLFI